MRTRYKKLLDKLTTEEKKQIFKENIHIIWAMSRGYHINNDYSIDFSQIENVDQFVSDYVEDYYRDAPREYIEYIVHFKAFPRIAEQHIDETKLVKVLRRCIEQNKSYYQLYGKEAEEKGAITWPLL